MQCLCVSWRQFRMGEITELLIEMNGQSTRSNNYRWQFSPGLPPLGPFSPPSPTTLSKKPLMVYHHRQTPPTETSQIWKSTSLIWFSSHCSAQGKRTYTFHSISKFVSYAHLYPSLHAFTSSLSSMVVLKSVQKAISLYIYIK